MLVAGSDSVYKVPVDNLVWVIPDSHFDLSQNSLQMFVVDNVT